MLMKRKQIFSSDKDLSDFYSRAFVFSDETNDEIVVDEVNNQSDRWKTSDICLTRWMKPFSTTTPSRENGR